MMDGTVHLPSAEDIEPLYTTFPIPVLVTDAQFQIQWQNDAALAMLPQEKQTLQILRELCMGTLSPAAFGWKPMQIPLQTGYLIQLMPIQEPTPQEDPWKKAGTVDGFGENFRLSIDRIFADLLMLKFKSRLYEDNEAYQHLRSINAQCFRLLRDSRNLDTYLQLHSGRLQPQLIPYDLTTHLQRLCSALQLELEAKTHVRLEYQLPEQPVLIRADAELLDIALMNLVGNSIKYGFSEGLQLTLSMQLAAGGVILRLTDNGPGVPISMVERIYAPFFSYSAAQDPTGMGLGLTVVREIITLHGGQIFTVTGEDNGMSITIRLPLLTEAESWQLSSSTAVRGIYTADYYDRYSPLHIFLSESITPPMP